MHGHVLVNGKKVNIPSYLVKKDDTVQFKANSKVIKRVKELIELAKDRGVPPWLKLDTANLKGQVIKLPAREDVGFPIQEKLIVELYSK